MEERVVEEQLRVLWGAKQFRTWQCLPLIMGPVEGPMKRGNLKRKKTMLKTKKTMLKTKKKTMLKTKKTTTTIKRQGNRALIIRTREEEAFLGLPHHLFFKILALLPVPKLFQVRLVCKSWNSLVRSPAFLQAWSLEAPSECWLVMGRTLCRQQFSGSKEFMAYAPSLGKWFHLPLDPRANPSISSYLGISSSRIASGGCDTKFNDLCIPSTFLMASAGGLMCCVINDRLPPTICADILPDVLLDHHRFRVLVFNCLTGAFKLLPQPPNLESSRNARLSLCVNSATHSYYVIITDVLPQQCSCMFVYDSKSSGWKHCKKVRHCREFRGDVLNGDLFHYLPSEGAIAAYNAEMDSWSKIKAPVPGGDHSSGIPVYLFKFKGQLCAARRWSYLTEERPFKLVTLGFLVYKMECASGETPSWVEVARTPPEFSVGISTYDPKPDHATDFNFTGHGNLICMTGVNHNPYWYEDKVGEYSPPLVYDLSVDTWYHLPCHRGFFDFLGLFAFEPRLDVMV